MKKTGLLKNIVAVAFSNCTNILAGIVVGFIIPKILSMDDYGFYKTFTLYTTYIGLFNLGLADGIVLKYGDKNYDQLNRERFRSFFQWFLIIHYIAAAVLLLSSFFANNSDIKFIIIALSIDLFAVNLTGYFQQISQITQRFKEYSLRRIIQSICTILIVCIAFIIYKKFNEISYRIYVVLTLIAGFALTGWYIYTYREIVFGPRNKLLETKKEVKALIANGFPLLFANLCSTLILSLDRQFVSILFSARTYAVYAFAYNMLSLVTVATSAVSAVLFPALKRTSQDALKSNYSKLIGIMMVFVFGAIISYYPLRMIITWYLPKYTDSIEIFRIIFPGLAISSCITVIMHNYYKVIGKNVLYFKISIAILMFSGLANAIAYLLFHSTTSISIASILSMFVWYISVEQLFVREYRIRRTRNLIYLFIMCGVFYISTSINNILISCSCYLICYIVLTTALENDILRHVMDKIRSKESSIAPMHQKGRSESSHTER